MVSDFRAHKLVVEVRDDFPGGAAHVSDEVADSRKHVVFEGLERVDIFLSCTAIDGE